MGFYMSSKYLIAGICGYKIGIPMDSVQGVEIIKPSSDIQCYAGNMETVRFRGREIIFINLRKKLNNTKENSNILIALNHPFCTLGISVDVLEGMFECEEITLLPEIIRKASGNLLENFGVLNGRTLFTIRIEPLLSLEEFKKFETGMAA